MKFSETIMYKKGIFGEHLFDEYIKSKGTIVSYKPMQEGKHPFDRLMASKDKKRLFVVDVKTVSARKKYPDTGISINHYKEYLYIQKKYGVPVWLVFVDSLNSSVYGNTLKELCKEVTINHNGKTLHYPIVDSGKSSFSAVGGAIIYFPLIHMKEIGEIPKESAEKLEGLSNYGYKKDMEHKKGFNDWITKDC